MHILSAVNDNCVRPNRYDPIMTLYFAGGISFESFSSGWKEKIWRQMARNCQEKWRSWLDKNKSAFCILFTINLRHEIRRYSLTIVNVWCAFWRRFHFESFSSGWKMVRNREEKWHSRLPYIIYDWLTVRNTNIYIYIYSKWWHRIYVWRMVVGSEKRAALDRFDLFV